MKAHEIIKSIRYYGIIKLIRYYGVKLTHLNTLSSSVDQMDNTKTINHADSDDFMIIILLNRLSKISVTLSQFVPCINGVPLEEPLPFRCGEETQKQCSQELEPCECAAIDKQYNEAKKSVIFEGWEAVATNKIHHHNVFNSELGLEIEFYKEKESLIRIWHRTRDTELTIIQTLADLAEATTKNSIKLK